MVTEEQGCKNCGSTSRPIRGRGYCGKCYGPASQIRNVENWDRSRPETLNRFPPNCEHCSTERFEKIRQGFLRELERRLRDLRRWHQPIRDSVGGVALEIQLDRMARYAGCGRRTLFHGLAGHIESVFDSDQRRELRRLLYRIEAARRWAGVDLAKVFEFADAVETESKAETETG